MACIHNVNSRPFKRKLNVNQLLNINVLYKARKFGLGNTPKIELENGFCTEASLIKHANLDHELKSRNDDIKLNSKRRCHAAREAIHEVVNWLLLAPVFLFLVHVTTGHPNSTKTTRANRKARGRGDVQSIGGSTSVESIASA